MQQESGLVLWAVNDPWARVISAQNSVWPIYHSTIHLQSFLERQRALLQCKMCASSRFYAFTMTFSIFHEPISYLCRERSGQFLGWKSDDQLTDKLGLITPTIPISKLLSLWFIRICVMVNIYIFFCHFFTVIFSCTGLPQLDICGHT
jgi:hypothetical protein